MRHISRTVAFSVLVMLLSGTAAADSIFKNPKKWFDDVGKKAARDRAAVVQELDQAGKDMARARADVVEGMDHVGKEAARARADVVEGLDHFGKEAARARARLEAGIQEGIGEANKAVEEPLKNFCRGMSGGVDENCVSGGAGASIDSNGDAEIYNVDEPSDRAPLKSSAGSADAVQLQGLDTFRDNMQVSIDGVDLGDSLAPGQLIAMNTAGAPMARDAAIASAEDAYHAARSDVRTKEQTLSEREAELKTAREADDEARKDYTDSLGSFARSRIEAGLNVDLEEGLGMRDDAHQAGEALIREEYAPVEEFEAEVRRNEASGDLSSARKQLERTELDLVEAHLAPDRPAAQQGTGGVEFRLVKPNTNGALPANAPVVSPDP